MKHGILVSLLVAGASLVAPAWAQVLIAGPAAQITVDELEASNTRVPELARKQAMQRTDVVGTQVTNIYTRRLLAEQARAAGFDKTAPNTHILRLALDRALSDLWLEKLDAEVVRDEAALERLARTHYTANLARFQQPEQVRASHILLSKDGETARADAEKLLAELRSGADFADAAKRLSKDPGSAARGGDLGLFARGRMVKPFEDAAFAIAAPGQLASLVESQFGFHIIRLDERVAPKTLSFEEARPTLINEARTRVINEARNALQAKLLEGSQLDNAAIEAYSAKFR